MLWPDFKEKSRFMSIFFLRLQNWLGFVSSCRKRNVGNKNNLKVQRAITDLKNGDLGELLGSVHSQRTLLSAKILVPPSRITTIQHSVFWVTEHNSTKKSPLLNYTLLSACAHTRFPGQGKAISGVWQGSREAGQKVAAGLANFKKLYIKFLLINYLQFR